MSEFLNVESEKPKGGEEAKDFEEKSQLLDKKLAEAFPGQDINSLNVEAVDDNSLKVVDSEGGEKIITIDDENEDKKSIKSIQSVDNSRENNEWIVAGPDGETKVLVKDEETDSFRYKE